MHRRRQMQQLETHAVPTTESHSTETHAVSTTESYATETHAVPTNHLKIVIQTNYKTKHALTPNINTKIQKQVVECINETLSIVKTSSQFTLASTLANVTQQQSFTGDIDDKKQ